MAGICICLLLMAIEMDI